MYDHHCTWEYNHLYLSKFALEKAVAEGAQKLSSLKISELKADRSAMPEGTSFEQEDKDISQSFTRRLIGEYIVARTSIDFKSAEKSGEIKFAPLEGLCSDVMHLSLTY